VLANGTGEWLGAIAEGLGVCLCPASIAGYYPREEIAHVLVEGLAENVIGLGWRRGRLSPLLRSFTCGA
jgi:DNA-binding transcriptional LysR family regulator